MAPCIVRGGGAREVSFHPLGAAFGQLEIVPRTSHAGARGDLASMELLEGEAKRIAHALHDETGQLVVLLGLKVAEALRHAPPRCASCLEDMAGIIDQLERQIRDFSHELRPAMLDDYGLIPSLEYLASGVAERTGLTIRILGGEIFAERPPSLVEIVLYRSVQEALINVSRHASARNVTIRFRRSARALHCSIRDDGAGLDPARASRGGLGLVGMRHRIEGVGGRLLIHSRAGEGVALRIRVPTAEQHCHVA